MIPWRGGRIGLTASIILYPTKNLNDPKVTINIREYQDQRAVTL